MSIARHHAEWLSLVPVSGPFLSLPVLMEAFNTGLEPHDPEIARLLRQEYATWQEFLEKRKADPAPHHNWIKFVLTQILDLDDRVLVEGQAIPQTMHVELLEHREFLRPTIVVTDPFTKKVRLLIQTYPRAQELTSYVAGSSWKASPDTRMTELMHGTGVRLGLVTNGEHWMLVDAPKGETSGYASWYASLWLEEPITLRAFRSLLSASRFFNVPDDQTLEALLTKSASNLQEVTDQLGYQVRRAVEVLIHSLDRADQDFGRELLADVAPEQLYESALTVMMRLVFLFCAEERELIPSKPFPVYEQNYSVSAISKQLRELADQQGEELLERRFDAWPRLLAAFRAVYGGLKHDDLHIPAYGGNLFNPDRFPFLEGRQRGTSWRVGPAHPLPVNNRTVLHLLEALQYLETKVPGGREKTRRRLSFRALDIEQIGHVYEGLLDHTAKRAAEPFLGLAGTREKEPELSLAKLEELLAKGEDDLLRFLKDQTGRSESALRKSLKVELDNHEAARFRTACQSDEALWRRVEPLVGLLRKDSFGYPVVIPKGSVFVTAGTDRRSSGTHYTPRSLTEPIVQYTLEPLVYVGPAEGMPKGEWRLKSARELLELKICDMACGSGAFLVQAARYMAERLLEAWDNAKKANPNTPGITPEGMPSTGKTNEALIPDDPAERKTYAMRIIAQRCLYGVDKNPLAVEMAKLSLWLLTLAKDKPFEFLDHSIRCGDSLVGLHSIDQLRHFDLKPAELKVKVPLIAMEPYLPAVDDAIDLRLKLEDLPTNTVEDVQRQEQLLIEANEKIARLRCAADLLVAAEFWGKNAKDKLERIRHAAVKSGHYVEKGPTEEFERIAREAWSVNEDSSSRSTLLPFHWPLEFPEVIVKRGGFDALVGNPPFQGGTVASMTLGLEYMAFIKMQHEPWHGKADLVGAFFRLAFCLSTHTGLFGYLATASLIRGETVESSIVPLVNNGASLIRGRSPFLWPGQANVAAVCVWIKKGEWNSLQILDDECVCYIGPDLEPSFVGQFQEPYSLISSCPFGALGVKLSPSNVILDAESVAKLPPDVATAFVHVLGGEELYGLSDLSKSPMAIDPKYATKSVISIIENTLNRIITSKDDLAHAAPAKALMAYIASKPLLFACGETTHKQLTIILVPQDRYLLKHKSIGFPADSWALFTILQSEFHVTWSWKYGIRRKEDLCYSPKRCAETFPLVELKSNYKWQKILADIGYAYHKFREMTGRNREIGMTDLYNRFHDTNEFSADIKKLRDLHVEMDQAVAAAYGWSDLELDHGFHETKQGVRFTISEPARREVLQSLLKLNHERYAEEVRQGLHKKGRGASGEGRGKKKATSKPAKQEASLFDMEHDE